MRTTRGIATILTLALTGCFDTTSETPTFVADDVRLEMPTGNFRSLGGQGEVMGLADDVATDVNGWVAELAGGFGEMLTELSKQEPTREDGQWRIYGPFDAEDEEDISFMARIEGEGSRASFEIFAGTKGADPSAMAVIFAGELSASKAARSGRIMLDFDAIGALEALRPGIGAETLGGKIEIGFDRELESKAKTVELEFDGFHYANAEEDLEYRDETYLFDRQPDGAGEFHFATWGTFEDQGWSGPERERLTVDMAWDDSEAGRARGRVLQVDGEGDLRFGDIVMEECFDAGFALTWAGVNAPYDGLGGYDEGDASACKLDASVFED